MDWTEDKQAISLKSRHWTLQFDRANGRISSLLLSDGIRMNEVLGRAPEELTGPIPVQETCAAKIDDDCIAITVTKRDDELLVRENYEFYSTGYFSCAFSIEAVNDVLSAKVFRYGLALKRKVLGESYVLKNAENKPFRDMAGLRPDANPCNVLHYRAISLAFSTDSRAVTNGLDLLCENMTANIEGLLVRKVSDLTDDELFLGFNFGRRCFRKGFRYENRWAAAFTSVHNEPNLVRGQRLYHWYGHTLRYPPDEILREMAEYGCSILGLHSAVFVNMDGQIACDENELSRVVKTAHELGIKVVFYCTPYLFSWESPKAKELDHALGGTTRIWAVEPSLKNKQAYELHTGHNCDELCLRCEDAFRHVFTSILACFRKYGMDGLYFDSAWPAIGLCNMGEHGHKPGLFNFYDYWKMIRNLRQAIGPDKIMIGHGGGLVTISDFVEGFNSCLTGEGQSDCSPRTLNVQSGKAPCLWIQQRSKRTLFRSAATLVYIVKEGITPMVGLGLMGTDVIATLDPADFASLLPLWQMWRGFPVERARFYNHLSAPVVALDNPEVVYSLFVTDDRQALLILCRGGGDALKRYPAVGCNVTLDIQALRLPGKMKCVRMKGRTYESSRMTEAPPVENGVLRVPEIEYEELMGFVLYENTPPLQTIKLKEHLAGRSERLPAIFRAKQKRLEGVDRLIDAIHGAGPVSGKPAADISANEFFE